MNENDRNLEIRRVPFLGTELMAARDVDGQIWAGVRWMCGGIGLSKGQMQRERSRIQEDKVLLKGERNLVLPTEGGSQEVLCLKLDYVPLWLAKIHITPAMARNTPEVAERLEQYQLKAKDILAAAFLPPQFAGQSSSDSTNTTPSLLQAIEKLTAITAQIDQRLAYIENQISRPQPEPATLPETTHGPKRPRQLQPEDVERVKEIIYDLAERKPVRVFWDSVAIRKEDAYRQFELHGFEKMSAMRALRDAGIIKAGEHGRTTPKICFDGVRRRAILVLTDDPREKLGGV